MLDVLNKLLESTYVVIEEVDLDNWGWGGSRRPITESSSRSPLTSEIAPRSRYQVGSSEPDCSAIMYCEYQSGQFSSWFPPVRFSCSP